MEQRDMGGDVRPPDALGGPTSAPTLDQVYAAIMSKKQKAQELLPTTVTAPEPVVRNPSGLSAGPQSNGTLEQLLLQGLAAGLDEESGDALPIMRSNTMENILRGTLSGGRELHELMLDWSRSLPEEKFAEGLASDMQAIDAAPPDVQTLRRTFTLERILSGAEADLAGMLKANQQQQLPLVRQPSGAVGTTLDFAGGCDAGPSAAVRLCGRLASDRLQCQESLHRLAASSGPGQHPRPGVGPVGAPPRGPSALVRHANGSSRHGAAAALVAEEETLPRSPKRHKLHHLKQETGPVGGSGPHRTWSQSLLDLAKAAAALDGRESDDDGEAASMEKRQEAIRDRHVGEQVQPPQRRLHDGHSAPERPPNGESKAASGVKAEMRSLKVHEEDGDGTGGLVRSGSGGHFGVGRDGSCNGLVAGAGPGSMMAAFAGGVAEAGVRPAVGSTSVVQLLQSLSEMRSQGRPQQSPQDTLLVLRAEVERLQHDNEGLSGQLETVLNQVEVLQQKNARMKQMLLDACLAKGIQADMDLLNVSLQHHRAQPMPEAQATHIAATVLGLNGGDVLATVQHLIGFALLRISEGQQNR